MSTRNFFLPQLDNLKLLFDLSNVNAVSGSTWKDLSGNGNDGAVTGTLSYADGSAIFNGSQYVTVPNIQHASASTIFVQMKVTSSGSRRNPYNQAYGGYGTMTLETANTISSYFGDAGADAAPYLAAGGSFVFTDNQWFNITITRDTSNYTKILNKGGVTSHYTAGHAYGVLTTDNNPILIGAGYQSNFIGEMQSVAIWDYRLTIAEVKKVIEYYRHKMI